MIVCFRCGYPDGDNCPCVQRRTFRRSTLAESIGMRDFPLPYFPRIPGENHQHDRDPRAPRHKGPPWTCDHLEHSPTEGRGPVRRTQNHAHPFVVTERWTPKGAA